MRNSPFSFIIASVLLAAAPLAFGASTACGQTFNQPIDLSNTSDLSVQQQIAVTGGNVYVVWADGAVGSREIFVRASTDGGSTFSATQNLSSNATDSVSPQIAVSGSNVYVVWQDGVQGQNNIFFRASHDFGMTFDAAQSLGSCGQSLCFLGLPQIAASDTHVYVVWEETVVTSTAIVVKISFDSGATFQIQKTPNSNIGFSVAPQVAVAGGNLYVAWEQTVAGVKDVMVAASTSNGSTFAAPQNLSVNPGASRNIRLAAAGNNVYVVWQDDTPGNDEIFFSASNNSGATFSTAQNISFSAGFSGFPSIAAVQNNVYIAWLDSTNTNGSDDIFFSMSSDGGHAFTSPFNASNSPGASTEPDGHKVVASGTLVYLIWQNENPTGPMDIFIKASTNSGAFFGSTVNLSANGSNSILPALAISGCSVYVAWQDDGPGNPDIFFAVGTHGGGSGAPLQGMGPAINLSNNAGGSFIPRLGVSCSNIYAVWSDNTPGDPHAFVKVSHDSGITFGPSIDLSLPNTALNNTLNDQPAIAVSGHNVYVTWSANNTQTGASDIYFAASTNDGVSFAPTINLSNNPGNSFEPQVAADGDNVYVVWPDNTSGNFEILFARSTDKGATFASKNISNTPGFSDFQKIAVSGSNVFVAWRDGNAFNLLFTASTDGGVSFGPSTNLSGLSGILNNVGILNPPQILAFGNTILLAWDGFNMPHAFFTRSSDAGITFAPAVDLSPTSSFAVQPQLAVSASAMGTNVYVAWSDTTSGNSEVLLARSTNGGTSFSNPMNLSNNPGESGGQRIRASGSNVYVVWRDATPGNTEIFFAVSYDGGAGFSSPLNLSNNVTPSDMPEIAVSDLNVFVIWADLGVNSIDDIFLRAGVPPVAAVQSATSAGPVSFSTDGGGFCRMTAVAEANLPQQGKPNVSFPFGFFDWSICGLTPGQTVTVTITYPSNIPSPAQFWKFINSSGWTQVQPPILGSDNGDNILTLTITDGVMPGDIDSVVNGEIVDPGGPAVGSLSVIAVTIDIKPDSKPNSINPRDRGLVPVAILTTAAFNGASVNPATVRFGATGTEAAPVRSALRDVNGDRKADLVLQFRVRDTGIQCGMTSAALTGRTKTGQPIKGSDSIVTVGCP